MGLSGILRKYVESGAWWGMSVVETVILFDVLQVAMSIMPQLTRIDLVMIKVRFSSRLHTCLKVINMFHSGDWRSLRACQEACKEAQNFAKHAESPSPNFSADVGLNVHARSE
jgi:hypothetical protein